MYIPEIPLKGQLIFRHNLKSFKNLAVLKDTHGALAVYSGMINNSVATNYFTGKLRMWYLPESLVGAYTTIISRNPHSAWKINWYYTNVTDERRLHPLCSQCTKKA